MNVPENLLYTPEHEWIRVEEDNIAFVGITDYAQSQLGDIVFIEIETLSQNLAQHSVFGTIEAVKTVSDMFMPVTGEILEVNQAVVDNPSIVNSDPYGEGWMVKIKVTEPEELVDLLGPEPYKSLFSI